DRVPTFVGIFQKAIGGGGGTWVPVGSSAGVFVRTTGDTMTGDLIMDGARIGINELAPTISLDIDGTDAIQLPAGTTAEQPAGVDGRVRFNTTKNQFEGFANGVWDELVFSSDGRLNADGLVLVSTNPGPDGFTSISAAVDSITTASDTNRFTVLVSPDTYIEPPIVMKPFVSVVSIGGVEDSVIEPISPNQDIVIGTGRSTIHGFAIRGATGSGFAGVRVLDTAAGNARFTITDCSIRNCAKLLVVNSTSANARIDIDRCTLTATDNTERAVEVIGGIGGVASYIGTDIDIIIEGDAALINAVLVTGPTADYLTDSFTHLGRPASAGGLTPVTGFVAEDGCNVTLGLGLIKDFDINLHIANVGAGPDITILSGRYVGSITRDIFIEHPGTTGSMMTNTQRINTFVNSSADVSIFYLDPIDSGIVSVGSFFLGTDHDKITDVNDLITAGPMMGLMTGGEITEGAGAFDVDVSAGFGYLEITDFPIQETRRVEWNASTLTIPAVSTQWIFVNNSGTVTTGARPDERNNIILGRATTDTTELLFLENIPVISHHASNLLNVTIREALGPIYVSGSLVAENAVTDRALDVGSGIYFIAQNRITPSGGTPITFTEFFNVGGVPTTAKGVTQVNNTQYDDGTDLVALSAGFFAKHSLYTVADGSNERYLFVFSQEEFATFVDAEAAGVPNPPSSFDAGSVALLSNIIVEEGTANIIQIQDARPILGFKASAVSATAQHGNLFGLGNDDHPQYLLVDGTRAMGGTLAMGSNNITTSGLVDGVDVSNHQARHLPNGSDPITTAAPTSSLTATSTNDGGIQNSLARSDHGHAITTGAPNTTLAPEDANTIGVATTLARSDHLHQFTTGSAVTLNPASSNTTGSANAFARSDHTHQITGFQETIDFENGGVPIGGPFTVVNFTGDGVSAVDAGGGELTVTIPGSIRIEEEGVSLGQFTAINFFGTGITAVDGGGGEAEVTVTSPTIFTLQAVHLDNPNNADWTVNALAPAVADTANNALIVRRFDDTTEEGVGFMLPIPSTATDVIFRFVSRAQTAPGAAQTVQPVLYRRTIPNNASVTSWSVGFSLNTIGIPTNTNFQYDNQSLALTTLGLAAGTTVQFELTRQGGAAGDTLTGDWCLLQLEVEFN
ncbi:MAG: hypothetical protein WDZ68_00395, partial [Candidatus Paceibacterota bacterium]